MTISSTAQTAYRMASFTAALVLGLVAVEARAAPPKPAIGPGEMDLAQYTNPTIGAILDHNLHNFAGATVWGNRSQDVPPSFDADPSNVTAGFGPAVLPCVRTAESPLQARTLGGRSLRAGVDIGNGGRAGAAGQVVICGSNGSGFSAWRALLPGDKVQQSCSVHGFKWKGVFAREDTL